MERPLRSPADVRPGEMSERCSEWMSPATMAWRSFIEVPLATAPTSVTQFALKALAPALALFGGYTMRQDYAERVVRKRLNRKS